jgi:hypothetical protein
MKTQATCPTVSGGWVFQDPCALAPPSPSHAPTLSRTRTPLCPPVPQRAGEICYPDSPTHAWCDCVSGYVKNPLGAGQYQAWCSGSWTFNRQCDPCGRTTIPNGACNAPPTQTSTTVSCWCDAGYYSGTSLAQFPSNCLIDEGWKPAHQCLPCVKPAVPDGVLENGSLGTPPRSVDYICAPGYSGTPTTRTCKWNGNWNGVFPSCLIPGASVSVTPSP